MSVREGGPVGEGTAARLHFWHFIVANATTYARHTPSLLVTCFSCLISCFIRVGFVSPGSCLVTLLLLAQCRFYPVSFLSRLVFVSSRFCRITVLSRLVLLSFGRVLLASWTLSRLVSQALGV